MAVKKGATYVREAKSSEKKVAKTKAAKADAEDDQQEYEATTARRVWEFPELVDVLPEMCEEYRQIVTEATRLETRRKELSSLIMPCLDAVGETAIAGEGWVAVKARGRRTSLSEEKLLENGVTMDIIEACRVVNRYPYLQVRDPGNKKEGA